MIWKGKNMNSYKVIYNIKLKKKSSALYGLLLEESVKFLTLDSAHKFALRLMKNQKSKYEVIGKPIIEMA
jgi:hypothetical protein